MRNPVRSETDAFHIVIGCGVVIAAAALLGALLDPLVGVALVVGAVAGALVWEVATADPDRRKPLREAAADGQRFARERHHRVLVVANRTLASEPLRADLASRAAAGQELHLVAPILCSRVHYLASDTDREVRDARERLRETLEWAQANGIAATGTVGDPNVALGAIEDELRRFGADEVLISTHPASRSNWLETGILVRLRDELEIPVTHLVSELEPAA